MSHIEELDQILAKYEDAVSENTAQLVREKNINVWDAEKIVYLRSRSRWTQEKEDFLVSLAQQGKPLPNVYAGEDDE